MLRLNVYDAVVCTPLYRIPVFIALFSYATTADAIDAERMHCSHLGQLPRSYGFSAGSAGRFQGGSQHQKQREYTTFNVYAFAHS